MKPYAEFPSSLQKIADDKSISDLYDAAEMTFTSQENSLECLFHHGIEYGYKVGKLNLRIFCVMVNEARGPTQFFFSGKSVAEVAERLKKLENY
jgi:hypothetical protein